MSEQNLPSFEVDPRVRKVEILISTILRVGVVCSLAIVVLGTVLSFVHHPDYFRDKEQLQKLTARDSQFPHTMGEMFQGVGRGEGRAIITLGLFLLIATPVMRVAVSVLAFVYQGDGVFVVITLVVLALLVMSFVLRKGGG